MVTNVHTSTLADDFFADNTPSAVVSIPAPPRETARSAAPFVVVLVLLALASAVQALTYPELIAEMFGL